MNKAARRVCIFSRWQAGENYGDAPVETGGKQLSAGQLYLIFESLRYAKTGNGIKPFPVFGTTVHNGLD